MLRRSQLLNILRRTFAAILRSGPKIQLPTPRLRAPREDRVHTLREDILWYSLLAAAGCLAVWKSVGFVLSEVQLAEVGRVVLLGLITLLRVIILIGAASLLWVPVGVYVGMRPRVASIVQPVAQFLSAFPANLLFPVVVSAIVTLKLNANIWLSPLMILGTQWYILFNVIAGASALPTDLRHASENLRISGWLWWRRVALPAIFPFYLTGAITASGGSWNAAIVAEVVSWGHEKLTATGIGSYIAEATDAGDFPRTVLGIAIMSLFVVLLNRFFWRPLYTRAERKFRLQ
jgi:NitT/TauT family transport system permease protein